MSTCVAFGGGQVMCPYKLKVRDSEACYRCPLLRRFGGRDADAVCDPGTLRDVRARFAVYNVVGAGPA